MSQPTSKPSDRNTGNFGFNPRPRRKVRPIVDDGRSTEDLVAEFLKTREITKCDPVYADGAVKNSGAYDF